MAYFGNAISEGVKTPHKVILGTYVVLVCMTSVKLFSLCCSATLSCPINYVWRIKIKRDLITFVHEKVLILVCTYRYAKASVATCISRHI